MACGDPLYLVVSLDISVVGLNTFPTAPCTSWLSPALDPLAAPTCPSLGLAGSCGAEGGPRALGSQFSGNGLLVAY